MKAPRSATISLGEPDRLAHPAKRRRLVDLGAVGAQELASARGSSPRASSARAVAARRADQRQGDPGVAAGRLDDRPARARASPSRSAASIIATPIRSLTEPPGFRYSSFATTSAPRPSPRRRRATSGVPPTTRRGLGGDRATAAGCGRGLGHRRTKVLRGGEPAACRWAASPISRGTGRLSGPHGVWPPVPIGRVHNEKASLTPNCPGVVRGAVCPSRARPGARGRPCRLHRRPRAHVHRTPLPGVRRRRRRSPASRSTGPARGQRLGRGRRGRRCGRASGQRLCFTVTGLQAPDLDEWRRF